MKKLKEKLEHYTEEGVIQNSELSWLHFNKRVLDESQNSDTPIIEQCRFISIFQSNFIEFFNVRVGILNRKVSEAPYEKPEDSDLTHMQLQTEIYHNSKQLFEVMDQYYLEKIQELRKYDIYQLGMDELDKDEYKKLKDHYHRRIEPMLLPQIVTKDEKISLRTNTDYLIYELCKDDKKYFGIINYTTLDEQYYFVGDKRYIITEDYLGEMAKSYFEDYEIICYVKIKMIRNMDKNTNIYPENSSTSKREHIRNLIHTRDKLEPVLIVTDTNVEGDMRNFLIEGLRIEPDKLFVSQAPLDLDYFYDLEDDIEDEKLYYPKYEQNKRFDHKISFATQIIEKDKFIITPYDDFDEFVKYLEEASINQNVKSISISLYRIASNSKLLQALLRARKEGKDVNVMIEMRARFDEADNLDYSQILRNAGCNISYGPASYKVHSKICLVEYIDDTKICMIGTGNFHEKTANTYSDFYLMTADQDLCEDVKEVFKYFFKEVEIPETKKLLVSPWTFKDKLIKEMDKQKKKGKDGYIFFKMNSFTDVEMAAELIEASQAGVKCDCIVRGKSSLIPQVEGYTDNVYMKSIVGRFLEHARIYKFGKNTIYIGSADLMDRNLNRRVEVIVKLEDKDVIETVNKFIDIQLQDDVNGRAFNSQGGLDPQVENPSGFVAQEYLVNNKI